MIVARLPFVEESGTLVAAKDDMHPHPELENPIPQMSSVSGFLFNLSPGQSVVSCFFEQF
jgi:hypothetical protein